MTEFAVPILLSRDLHETLAFYEALGFENVGAAPDEWDYLILARGALQLHVSYDEAVDPLRTSTMCYLYVDDARALFELWSPSIVPDVATGRRIIPPQDTDYGMREFALVDTNGNLLRVGSPL
jgi:catechol 2,3-dioxygenase-like lactoylglutathione lyase family enzyme